MLEKPQLGKEDNKLAKTECIINNIIFDACYARSGLQVIYTQINSIYKHTIIQDMAPI